MRLNMSWCSTITQWPQFDTSTRRMSGVFFASFMMPDSGIMRSLSPQKASTGTTVAEVRTLFSRQSDIDDFKSVTAKDIEVTKQGDKIVVSFAYQREIHLAGPAYLTLKYSGQSK